MLSTKRFDHCGQCIESPAPALLTAEIKRVVAWFDVDGQERPEQWHVLFCSESKLSEPLLDSIKALFGSEISAQADAMSQNLSDRMKRAAGVIRRAVKGYCRVRLFAQSLPKFLHESGFSHPRFGGNENDLPGAILGLGPAVFEQRQFGASTYQGAEVSG